MVMRETMGNEKERDFRRLLLAFALGLLVALSAYLTLGAYENEVALGTYEYDLEIREQLIAKGGMLAHALSFLWRLWTDLGDASFQLSLLAIVMTYGIWHLLPLMRVTDRGWMIPFSAVSGFACVLAESYHKTYSWDLVFANKANFAIALIKAAGTAVVFYAVLVLISHFEIARSREGQTSRQTRAKSFRRALLVILVCWLPYIVSIYPASAVADASDQVAQVVGAREFCRSITRVAASPSGMLLNNHHPVLHTLLIGACVKVGGFLHSYNIGFLLYSSLQCLAFAVTLAAQTVMLEELCADRTYPRCTLAFFAICPLFPVWGMTVDKDVYFSMLTWWMAAGFFQLARSTTVKTGHLVGWGAVMFIWLLIRNGGVYVIAACMPIIIWALRDRWRLLLRVVATVACVVTIYVVGIRTLLFGSLGISSSGSQEMLSVPFMQTARLLRDHPESFDEEDRKVLIELFGGEEDVLDTMVLKYDDRPTRSDGVKNLFDNNTSRSLGDYFKVWKQGLTKHPDTYLQALMCLDYGWIYPDNHENMTVCTGIAFLELFEEMLPGYHQPEALGPARAAVSAFVNCCTRLPLVGFLIRFSSYTWVYLIAFILMMRRKKTVELAAMSFYFLYYGVLFLGPVAYLRYALPAIVASPTVVALTALSDKDDAAGEHHEAAKAGRHAAA